MQFLPGDKVCFRASAVTPLDPKAHWRGVVQPGDGAGWIRVIWTRHYECTPDFDTWEDPTLLAKVGSVAANDRHAR